MSATASLQQSERRYYLRNADEQAAAFAKARRHSRHVVWLKRGIVVGAATIVGTLAGLTFFDPFSQVPADVSIRKATLNGSRITMEAPRLSGFRKDGRPYELKARTGVQDVRKPKIIDLYDIEARITVDEKNRISVTAPRGTFDSGGDLMSLRGSSTADTIRITSTSGYVINLKSADINFKTGSMVSKRNVSVRMTNGTVSAESAQLFDSGKKISFVGNVRTVLQTPGSVAAGNSATNPAGNPASNPEGRPTGTSGVVPPAEKQ